MSSVAALLVAALVLGAAVVWVQPMGLLARSPRRGFVSSSSRPLPASPSCPSWFVALAAPAALPVAVERAWLGCLAALVMAGCLGLAMGGPIVAVVMVLAVAAGLATALHLSRHRLDQVVQRGIPDALDAVARATRSGRSVVQALGDLSGPDASPAELCLASIAAQVEQGASLQVALTQMGERSAVPAVRLAVTALMVGSQTGAPPARAVEGVAATLRDRLALERELSAQSSQARASALVLVLSPIGFGLFAMGTDPRVAQFLLQSPMGWTCLTLGLGLNAAGAWWMRRIMADVR